MRGSTTSRRSRRSSARPDLGLPSPPDLDDEATRFWPPRGLERLGRRDQLPARRPADFADSHGTPEFALAFARIENHYFVNGGFFEVEDQLLRDAHRIADIPGVIVHGRYDVVCPIANAWDLHKAWPKAELLITPASGHSAFEAENVDALVEGTDRFAG
jgi:pimeloyl-ACP methyl ester carboxylesterase